MTLKNFEQAAYMTLKFMRVSTYVTKQPGRG